MRETRMELHWGRLIRCYVERSPTLDAMFRAAAAADADAEAVVDGSTRLTYRALDRSVDRLAAGLAARGVGKGDREAVMLGNRVEAVVAVLAIARIGAAVVLIGTRLRRPEIAYIVADSQACALVELRRLRSKPRNAAGRTRDSGKTSTSAMSRSRS